VVASRLARLWAMVLALVVWCLLIERVATGNLCPFLFKLGFSSLRWDLMFIF